MKTTIYPTIIALVCAMCFVSCEQPSSQQVNSKKGATVSLTEESITISDNNNLSFELRMNVGDGIAYSKVVEANQETSILSLLKADPDLLNEIALLLAQNNGNISINLSLPKLIDTTFIYHLDVNDVSDYNTKVLSGKCASLTGIFDTENAESDIIKWLYRKNLKNVGEETINNMRLYLQELKRTTYKEYISSEEIPIVTSLKDIVYKVSSDLVADNYYLFACDSEDALETFVEEKVSTKFEAAAHSLTQPIKCLCPPSTSGTCCILLIGIDNDWSYKVSPVGLICIDNSSPTQAYSQSSTFSSYRLIRNEPSDIQNYSVVFQKNNLVVTITEAPEIQGSVYLTTNEWSGDGISCNVNFALFFGGDVKTITLVREDHLAKWVGKGKKVIDLQEVSNPYLFSYELHLEDGDNYLPVVVTDLRGNKLEFKYNVGCESKPRNNTQINIENNVDVN